MDVQRAEPRKVDDFAREDVAIRDDDGDIGLEGADGVDELRTTRPIRLQHGEGFFERDLLDG